ncbi:AMP-binding protein [Piscinibacter aquaticus]|uniref:AMP-binding protein n=1 Tax=Piscinibacter aquaticus TaxID=392597 RepID=A0A5C6U115_9BURK|nr:AMP-binding protein [Piscinibacter aquaticus]
MYRTGDLGRWTDAGTLEHMGRKDHQVKVRGYRIELGEIESRLGRIEGVGRCVVVTREDAPGSVKLVAYFVPAPGASLEPRRLREVLKGQLPEYMVPSNFVSLDALPLLPNGKIDRKSLPEPTAADVGPVEIGEAAHPGTETLVAQTMARVLGLPAVGRAGNFFELGGHSLIAAKLAAQLSQSLGVQIRLRTLFEAPTVERWPQRSTRCARASAPASACTDHPSAGPVPSPAHGHAGAHPLRRGDAPGTGRLQLAFRPPSSRPAGSRRVPACVRRDGPAPAQPSHLHPGQRRWLCAARARPGGGCTAGTRGSQRRGPGASREASARHAVGHGRADLRTGARAAFHCNAVQARRRRPRPVLHDAPHRLGWLVVRRPVRGDLGPVRSVSPRAAADVGAAGGDLWRLRPVASGVAERTGAARAGRAVEEALPPGLPGERPRGGLPADRRHRARGGTSRLDIGQAHLEELRALAKRAGTTTSIVILAVYGALMSQWLREPMPAIGIPVRGRGTPELDAVMGFFNNMLPVRLRVDRSMTLLDWIRDVHRTMVAAYASQEAPFELLAAELQSAQGGMAPVLYQAMFSYQDARARQTRWGNLSHERLPLPHRGTTEDINLWMVELNNGIEAGLQYNADLFLPETASRLSGHLLSLLQAAVSSPEQTLAELLAASDADVRQIGAWAGQAGHSAQAIDFLARFEKLAQASPQRTAIRFADTAVSCAELLQRVNAATERLRHAGVPANAAVHLRMDDVVEHTAHALAAWRLGIAVAAGDSPMKVCVQEPEYR